VPNAPIEKEKNGYQNDGAETAWEKKTIFAHEGLEAKNPKRCKARAKFNSHLEFRSKWSELVLKSFTSGERDGKTRQNKQKKNGRVKGRSGEIGKKVTKASPSSMGPNQDAFSGQSEKGSAVKIGTEGTRKIPDFG